MEGFAHDPLVLLHCLSGFVAMCAGMLAYLHGWRRTADIDSNRRRKGSHEAPAHTAKVPASKDDVVTRLHRRRVSRSPAPGSRQFPYTLVA